MAIDTTPKAGDLAHDTLKKMLRRLNAGVPISNPPSGEVFGEVETIEHAHTKVHDGRAFVVSDRRSLTAGQEYRWLIAPPEGEDVVHLLFQVSSGSEYYVALYEAPTSVTGGANITVQNRNRNSANGAATAITGGVSAVSDGIRLTIKQVGGGTGGFRIGGDARSEEEWLLKAGTNYLFLVHCVSNGSIGVEFAWYTTPLGQESS